ncbi:MAG: hypothetical protein LBC14_03470, partial [Desulfovibrio sp.]|nr:hypothetical protein [Desulfovibrio sp.]
MQSTPGGCLNFEFDPSRATVSRPENSNDLVFEVEGGGKVTISGFFEVGDESLPTLSLPDGVEVAAADFFAGSGIDTATAAGPRAAGSGTSYADDAGDLLDGLDKLSVLGGTDQWDTSRGTPADTVMQGMAPLPDLLIGPVVITNGIAAFAVEGENLVFTIGQSATAGADTTIDWSITLPGTSAPGEKVVSLEDLDTSGLHVTDNGDGTYTVSGTMTIPAGSLTGTISIPTADDKVIEFDEILTLVLSNPQNPAAAGTQLDGGGSYTGMIIDNDLLIGPIGPGNSDPSDPAGYVTDGSAAFTVEGGELVFTIGQSSPSAADTEIDWQIIVPAHNDPHDPAGLGKVSLDDIDRDALGPDVTVVDNGNGTFTIKGTVTIEAGSQTGVIRIPTVDDAEIEFKDETLKLELIEARNDAADEIAFAGGTGEYIGTIRDNDLQIGPIDPGRNPDDPSSFVTDGSAAFAVEGENLVFTIGQSSPSTADTTVDWSITLPATGAQGVAGYDDLDASKFGDHDITATYDPASDSWTLSGTATIKAGERTGAVTIPTKEDSSVEFDENLTLVLSNPQNADADNTALAGMGEYTGTIIDNDLRVGPVDPKHPDPDDPDAYVTDGTAAFVVEGDDLVFTIGQSSPSEADTTLNWEITVPATGAQGEASYADFDASKFEDNGIKATYDAAS